MRSEIVKTDDLLVEILTEELPFANLEQIFGETFTFHLTQELKNFISESSKVTHFVTPRRFGCLITDVYHQESEQYIMRKGPSIQSAFKDGKPTASLIGFIKSYNIDNLDELKKHQDGYIYAQKTIPGLKIEHVLLKALQTTLKKLPLVKIMRWGKDDYSFARPVHNLLILHGNQTIYNSSDLDDIKNTDKTIFGLSPVNYTFGHRIMTDGKPIYIEHASKYSSTLLKTGYVIASFTERLQLIKDAIEKKVAQLNLILANLDNIQLLEEVTALVEYPVVHVGEFHPSFLEVPNQCLILSMAKNQKYFALNDHNGQLVNKFIFVANTASSNANGITKGNQKVLAARLADAQFFYKTDKKSKLSDFVPNLANIIYHNKLGSQLERVERIQNIATQIANFLKVNSEDANYAAYLLKADLTTTMVGEFPELQGIMGTIYAKLEGISDTIANAIEEHYYPRFSGDKLPNTPLATVVALADKLETLVGIWGIGIKPTGDKDPFAIRRSAMGVVRILLKTNLNILELLHLTFEVFNDTKKYTLNPDIVGEVYQFILQRLTTYLENIEKYPTNCVQSVLDPIEDLHHFSHLNNLLIHLQVFAANPQNQLLLQANKRIENILKKIYKTDFENINKNTDIFTIEESLLIHSAEIELNNLLNEENLTLQVLTKNLQHTNWNNYFTILTKFNEPITTFFDNIMVMAENLKLRQNRINLLLQLYLVLNKHCRLTKLI
jgi:glycyl-tRNA synthetase beta chain